SALRDCSIPICNRYRSITNRRVSVKLKSIRVWPIQDRKEGHCRVRGHRRKGSPTARSKPHCCEVGHCFLPDRHPHIASVSSPSSMGSTTASAREKTRKNER